MGKGLLAWWRRRIVARGLAGGSLLAVPVAVAAMIGFGTSLSGVAGGLSAVTSGPDAVPASESTGPSQLNDAVVALASSRQGSASSPATGGDLPGNAVSSPGSLGGSGGGSGSSGGSGGGSTTDPIQSVGAPAPPDVPFPGGGGSTGQTVDDTSGTLSNVLDGVDQTLNGLLGR